MKHIVIVTHNKYKKWEFREGFRRYLSGVKIIFKSQKLKEFCHCSPKENTKSKALQAFKKFKVPVLVDDTIFLFEKYNNFPGIHAKWLMDSIGTESISKLIQDGDRALFRCHLGFCDGKVFKIFQGEIRGHLRAKIDYEKIKKGLDYSALFIPKGAKIPMAEFYESRNLFNSHRMLAIRKFSTFLKRYYGNY